MSQHCVRDAVFADLERVLPLFESYRAFYGETPRVADSRRFLQQRWFQGESKVIVAEIEERIVGFTQLFPSFSSVTLQRFWILNDLFVHPEARSHGIGRKLLQAAADLGRDSCAKQLFIEGAVANPTARRLYEDFGFIRNDDYVYFHLPLTHAV